MSESPQDNPWVAKDKDVALMLRFRDGDESAFEQLVDNNVRKVHALVYRFLGSPTEVEDITQEVFLRLYKTAPRYVPSAKFSTYLYRIVANLCFNALRSKRKTRFRQIHGADGDDEAFYSNVPDTSGPLPDGSLKARELQTKISEAINKLPESQKLAILLNKYEDKSYDEIAEILECSTMAVKSLLSRARENLRQSLENYLRPK